MADIKFDNPNFNKERYGKYFDDNGVIKDINGWMNERAKDLKSASDPADLVNKINKHDYQASLNKIKGKNFEKALDRFTSFAQKHFDGDFDYWLDTVPDRYDQFDDDTKAQFDALTDNKNLSPEEADKEQLKFLARYDEENGYPLSDEIEGLLEHYNLEDDERKELEDILNELLAGNDDGYSIDELKDMNNDFYNELAHAFDDSNPNRE